MQKKTFDFIVTPKIALPYTYLKTICIFKNSYVYVFNIFPCKLIYFRVGKRYVFQMYVLLEISCIKLTTLINSHVDLCSCS